jgi:hypothetical protein
VRRELFVEKRSPSCTPGGRVWSLEAGEILQRGQQAPNGGAQVVQERPLWLASGYWIQILLHDSAIVTKLRPEVDTNSSEPPEIWPL